MNKSYTKDLLAREDRIRTEFNVLWTNIEHGHLTSQQAQRTLDILYQRSMLDIIQKLPHYAKYYPAKQGYRKRLKNVDSLWWVDHATGGIDGWNTLRWFSNKQREHSKRFTSYNAAERYMSSRRNASMTTKKNNYYVSWKGYSNAITHFVIFRDGTPFMLLPLEDGCWGEPKRNGDAIQVEVVNPLAVTYKDYAWYYWAGKLPDEIVKTQPPERLAKPFRGAKYMVPYLREQIITNIKLKRLCIAATEGCMDYRRMSQHTDWREDKYDMGPLWPFDTCNEVAFERYPVESYSFLQNYVPFHKTNKVFTVDDYARLTAYSQNVESVMEDVNEYQQVTLRAKSTDTGHDMHDDDQTVDSVREVQNALVRLYGPAILPLHGVDGVLGLETIEAVRTFQRDWNRYKFNNGGPHIVVQYIKEDGVPGVVTCEKLQLAIDSFKRTT